MKKYIITALALSMGISAWAEYMATFHKKDGSVASFDCEQGASVTLKTNNLEVNNSIEVTEIPYAALDSLTFDEFVPKDTVYVVYNGSKVSVENPYKESIQINTDGAKVTVNSASAYRDVVYALSGSSTDGYFMIDSEKKFKVLMNNLSLTSAQVTSPIRSLSGKGMTVVLKGKNSLTDSDKDTCNAVLRSKGQIIFDAESGDNSLTINAKQKRAIQSGDYIVMAGGKVEANSSLGNCIRANDYFLMTGGTMTLNEGNINVTNGYFRMDDGTLTIQSSLNDNKLVDIETETLDEDGNLVIDNTHGVFYMNGGTMNLTAKGEGCRCVKSDGDIVVKGGSIKALLSGSSAYIAGDGVTNATVLKAGGLLRMLGGKHELIATADADGARVLGADGRIVFGDNVDLIIENAASTFNYSTEKGTAKSKIPYCVKTDMEIQFDACKVDIRSSATSNGAVGISNTNNNIIVNKGADVTVRSATLAAIQSVEDDNENDNGRLLLNGGRVVASAVKEPACGITISSLGGDLISVSPYKHNAGFTGSKSCAFADRTYDNTAFSLKDSDGKVLLSHDGGFPAIDTAVLTMLSSYTVGAEYTYELGGESYTLKAGNAASTASVTKE